MTAPGLPRNDWVEVGESTDPADYTYGASEQNLVADNVIYTRNQITSLDAEVDTKGTYTKPPTGIPEADLSSAVQVKLNDTGGGGGPLDPDLVEIAALSPSNDDLLQQKAGVWANRTPAQVKTDFALTKTDVGLANVDNTSDANKPVSTATSTALAGKQAVDTDLTQIAAVIAANDDIIQKKSGVYVNRTPAQFKTDLALTKTDVGLSAVTNNAQYFPSGTDVAVADGGTGVSTLPAGLLKGAGTSPITAAVAGTDYYVPGGADVTLADGGTGASLTAPVADAMLFYDVSAGSTGLLTPSTGLLISGTNLIATAAGGGSAETSEMRHVFAGDPNGTPGAIAESGQTWNFTNSRTPNLVILSGKLYSADTVAGAQFAHAGVTLSATAGYMAADFNFGASGSTNSQSFEMAAWVSALVSPFNIPPDSPCRILCVDDHIEYRVVTGGVSTTIVSHPYSARGTANQRVEVVISKTKGIAVVTAPDGTVFTAEHALIGSLTVANVTIGSFLGAASTDKRVEIQTFSAGPTALTDAQRRFDIAVAQLASIVPVTGSYTVTAKDMNKVIEYNSASGGNITVPPDTTMGVAIGSSFSVRQIGAGVATTVAGAGVTLQTNGSLLTDGAFSEINVCKRAANTWLVAGDTA